MVSDVSQIVFTLNGRAYELSRNHVVQRLAGVRPEGIQTHAVKIGPNWYPVRQALEAAIGTPRLGFNTQTARRHLANLGFEVRGEVRQGAAPDMGSQERGAIHEAWHTEAAVQAAVVAGLLGAGWTIQSQANTATKEHGIDVVAERDTVTVGIEVKGFPSRKYADVRRAGEQKRTQPSTQAGHWFAQAVLAAMRLRSRHPEYLSVIALPDFPRYRALHTETVQSLNAAEVHVWWVGQDGSVDGPL
jgi:Holliday junction resolvase-like predicted endonuclease